MEIFRIFTSVSPVADLSSCVFVIKALPKLDKLLHQS